MMKKSLLLVLLLPVVIQANVFAEVADPSSVYTVNGPINSISVSESGVAVGSEDSNVHFLDAYLRSIWRHECGDWVESTAVSDEFVVAASIDKTLTVLDHSGQVRWERSLDSYVEYPHALDLYGDTIAVGTRDGYVHLFDTEGGLRWRQKTDAYLLFVKMQAESIVAVSDRGIYIFNLEGNLLGAIPLDPYVRSAYVSGEYIVVGLANNELNLFDVDGTLIWKCNLPDQIGSVHASREHVVAGLRDKRVYLFRADGGGEPEWSKELSDSVIAVSTEGNHVLAATLDDRLYLFNLNRIVLWEYPTKGRVRDVQITNSGVFIGTSLGYVYYFMALQDMPSTIFVMSVTLIVLVSSFVVFLRVFR